MNVTPLAPASASTPRRSNPSSLQARLPVAALALAGLIIALYLSAVQLHAVRIPWDPIFGPASSDRVLHSSISRMLPVPDATLGAAGYAAELIVTLAGGGQRWREQPRLVLLYGGIVAGLAVAGILLTAMQTFVLRSGCTLCLCSAVASVVAAWLARDEVLASLSLIRKR